MRVGAAGEVRRGPPHAHLRQRPPRLRPVVRRRAGRRRDGTLLGLQIDVVDDYGAFLQFGVGTHGNALSQIAGPYRIQHVRYRLRAALTNKYQQGAYRGFGAEVLNWVLERLVEKAARELGMDRDEIRRKNLLGPDQFPYGAPPATSTTAATTRRCWRRASRRSTSSTGARSGSGRARRAATSGSASCHARSAASSARRSSGTGSTSRSSRSPRARRARASDRPGGRDPGHPALAGPVGQQPRDDRLPGRGRGVRVDPLGQRRLRGLVERVPGHGPGRLPLHGDGPGAVAAPPRRSRRRSGGSGAKLETARGRRVPDGAVGVKGAPDRSSILAEIAATAYFFALNLPGGHGERPRGGVHLRPPVHDAAQRRSHRPRHLLSVRGPRLPHRGDRDRRHRARSRASTTSRCTTPARSSTRRRSPGRCSAARSRGSARRCRRSTSTTSEGSCTTARSGTTTSRVDRRAADAVGQWRRRRRSRSTGSRAAARAAACCPPAISAAIEDVLEPYGVEGHVPADLGGADRRVGQ